MAVYKRSYRAYSGRLTPAWSRFFVLTRYAMLTFTYNLNNFPASQNRRGPFPGFMGRPSGGGRPDGGGGGFRGGPLYPID